MARLQQGNRMPDFKFCTPYAGEGSVRGLMEDGPYHRFAFIFLRYYGCTLCQYDMHRYTETYSEITAGGGGFLRGAPIGSGDGTQRAGRKCAAVYRDLRPGAQTV